MDNIYKQQILRLTTIIVIITTSLLILLRLFHLEADFPENIRSTTVFYTDEGWYTSAAQRWMATGEWYLEGDFNPATTMPGFQLIVAGTFSLFGVSLLTARLTAYGLFILLIGSFYFFVRRNSNNNVAILATLLLSLNFVFFAYSRLALLEIPMLGFIFLSFLVADALIPRRPGLGAALAAGCFGFAVLIKTSAIFALPALLYLAWTAAGNKRQALLATGAAALVSLAITVGYQLFEKSYFPEDYAFFKEINYRQRMIPDLLGIIANIPDTLRQTLGMEKVLYPFTVVFVLALLLFHHKELRHNRLLVVALLSISACFAMICMSSYQPRRYFLPFVPFFSILFAVALFYVVSQGQKLWTRLAAVALGLTVIINSYQIAAYYLSIDYSWMRMIAGLKEQAAKDGIKKPVIMGNFANTIALDMPSVPINGMFFNKAYQPYGLLWQLDTYRPDYYVSVGIEPEFPVMEAYRSLKLARMFNVFDNYHQRQPMMLFRVQELR